MKALSGCLRRLLPSTGVRSLGSAVHPSSPVSIRLKNSLTRQIEDLRLSHHSFITWYCCGPTVYDSAHVGHAYSYVQFDLVRRILEQFANLEVLFVMNITDLDDKIINRANAVRNVSSAEEGCTESSVDRYGLEEPQPAPWTRVCRRYEEPWRAASNDYSSHNRIYSADYCFYCKIDRARTCVRCWGW